MRKRSAKFWLGLSLIVCLISMLGANFVQTGGYSITVKDLRWETSAGHMMSALLFIPKNASVKNPAPAIITSHGWYNNREMQDMNFVEYARRGYVVMSIDMYGHGNSDTLVNSQVQYHATGMTDAVELMATFPFVDKSRIGVTGHSNGGRAANWAVDDDNLKSTPLIKSVLLVAYDPTYTDKDGKYINKYGNRDVGVVAAKYDEFFFRVKNKDGSKTAPRDYINQATAQSFLNFGINPEEGEKRTSSVFYTKVIDGKEAIRAIFTPTQIHPWNTISNKVATFSLDFFNKALGAPNPIPSTNLVWYWKEIFNVIGLIGFAMFVFAFAKILLQTKYFGVLKTKEEPTPLLASGSKAKVWFWISLVLGAFVSFISYLYLPNIVNKPGFRPTFFVQAPVFFIGTWAVVNGLFTLVVMLVTWYFFDGKSISLKERGIAISGTNLWRTILLSLSVVSAAFFIVFFSDFIFKVDFRLWVIPVKAFTADKIPIIILYLPFFLIFYVLHSVSVNGFSFIKQGKEWVNVALLAFFTDLGALMYVIIQYGIFFARGLSWTEKMNPAISNIYGIWLFPILVYFPLAVILDRKLFKLTKNPYLGGIIFALIMTIMACTNTLTAVP
ncbi:Conserved membrane-spanning protein [uncultured spirochete]|uniref:Conserved membrane-spanning protein n=1 Tax=uncultured spirochete TaxID=156406 RepID=A0A3P3XMD0_9SPIR|nr:Conserved membrane-spanning protein [uncultured spirochete]